MCPENHPACLDFHHKNPKQKDFEIACAIRQGWTKPRILEEIEKCIVVCSNCHRKLHWLEKNALSERCGSDSTKVGCEGATPSQGTCS
jgi:hypothetical protein